MLNFDFIRLQNLGNFFIDFIYLIRNYQKYVLDQN